MAHLGLSNKRATERNIRHIKHPYLQKNTFDIINEYVNKLEHFDVEWFKILVDSFSVKAMYKLDNIVI